MTGHQTLSLAGPGRLQCFEATDRRADEGYVYVVQLGADRIKVGQSVNPKSRVANHVKSAAVHGLAATKAWVSTVHVNPVLTEKALIDFCVNNCRTRQAHEYFSGVAFADAVAYAESLPYERQSADDTAAALAAADYLDIPTACERLGISRWTLIRRIDDGEIDKEHVGSRVAIPVASVDAYIERQRTAPATSSGQTVEIPVEDFQQLVQGLAVVAKKLMDLGLIPGLADRMAATGQQAAA